MNETRCLKSHMLAFLVILVLPLVLAVVLGDVDGAASQISQ